MKTIKFTKLFTLFFALITLMACVNDDDFEVPSLDDAPADLEGGLSIDINGLISAYTQALNNELNDLGIDPDNPANADEIAEVRDGFTYDLNNLSDTETFFVEGYVISNDRAGNFFEELVIQNEAENAESGVRVMIDVNSLFTFYEFGRKVFVRLPGLHIGDSNGVLTLGTGETLEKISSTEQSNFIKRDNVLATIIPNTITLSEVAENFENTWVRFENMQFSKAEVLEQELTYATGPNDQFDGERTLESCDENSSIVFSTSTFADFKALPLPKGRGAVDGILTRNFFGDTFNLVVNSPETVLLSNDERCDPEVLECEGDAMQGDNTLFIENFESINDEDDLDGTWTNVNVSGGSTRFILDDFNNNNYFRISGFNTDEDPLNVWLVTPPINLDNSTDEALSFDIQAAFDNGKILSAFITTSYTGDPLTTQWTQIDVNIPTGPSSGFGSFESSGLVNISCLEGDLHVGFLYEGADPAATTRYHVDNVRVTGN